MSIKLMSAIFETEFRDLTDDAGNVTKASTAKLVLLALADHANDEGEGAYPGITRMTRKTALSRQTVINTYDALKYNGIIYLVGTSKRNTNNYTINTKSFPRTTDADSQPALLVNSLDSTSQATLPEVVKPLDPNHHINTNETPPSAFVPKERKKKGDVMDGILFFDKQAQEQGIDKVEQFMQEVERGLRVNLPRTTANQAAAKRIMNDGRPFGQWLTWCISDEWRAAHLYLYADLERVWREYPQAFENTTGLNPQGLEIGV